MVKVWTLILVISLIWSAFSLFSTDDTIESIDFETVNICSQDSDCIVVTTACGLPQSINKIYQSVWNIDVSQRTKSQDTVCPMYMPPAGIPEAKCMEDKCTLQYKQENLS